MTNLGYIKRMSVNNFKSQNRGGRGIKGMDTIDDDYIEDLFMTTTHHYLMFFTNTGKVYRIKTYEIPEASRTSRGTAIINILQLQPGEKISAVIPIKEYKEDEYLFMATKNGIVKKKNKTSRSIPVVPVVSVAAPFPTRNIVGRIAPTTHEAINCLFVRLVLSQLSEVVSIFCRLLPRFA